MAPALPFVGTPGAMLLRELLWPVQDGVLLAGAVLAGQLGQKSLQVEQVHRLHQVPVAPSLLRPGLVSLLAPPSQRNDRDSPAPRLLADAAGGVQPVEP